MGLLVNLFGGPGVGKSTVALGVAYRLKLKQIRSEYVSEYAKDLVWEGRNRTLEWQSYVSSKQHRNVARVLNQVDVVVTDSPFLIGCFYKPEGYSDLFDSFMLERHYELDTLNYYIERVIPYDEVGRYQTEEEAHQIDARIEQWMIQHQLDFIRISGTTSSVEDILDMIDYRLGRR